MSGLEGVTLDQYKNIEMGPKDLKADSRRLGGFCHRVIAEGCPGKSSLMGNTQLLVHTQMPYVSYQA